MVSVVFSYSIMLCVMSYNFGVFLTVIVSLSLWNSVFSYQAKKNITLKQINNEKAYQMISGEEAEKCCTEDECGPGATNLEDMASPNVNDK